MSDYNGWKNRATWNVALWIQNDESLYNKALNYVNKCKRMKRRVTWTGFSTETILKHMKTPDGYSYISSDLCKTELTAMLRELR